MGTNETKNVLMNKKTNVNLFGMDNRIYPIGIFHFYTNAYMFHRLMIIHY